MIQNFEKEKKNLRTIDHFIDIYEIAQINFIQTFWYALYKAYYFL